MDMFHQDPDNDEETEERLDETEAKWRKERFEREQWLREQVRSLAWLRCCCSAHFILPALSQAWQAGWWTGNTFPRPYSPWLQIIEANAHYAYCWGAKGSSENVSAIRPVSVIKVCEAASGSFAQQYKWPSLYECVYEVYLAAYIQYICIWHIMRHVGLGTDGASAACPFLPFRSGAPPNPLQGVVGLSDQFREGC